VKKPVCVTCKVKMERVRSGVDVLEQYLNPPEPYQVWSGDLFECPGCGARIVADFANGPRWHVSEETKPPEADVVEKESLDWRPIRISFLKGESGSLVVGAFNPCTAEWTDVAVIMEPESENPVLALLKPFGFRGVRRILAEWEKRR
jgi:hypothetical protein